MTRLIPDNQPAVITEFTFNINESILILTFNEPVRATSLQTTAIIIQANRNETNSSLQYQLTGGFTASPNQREITINLATEDISALKRLPFATALDNTYLSVTSQVVQDMAFVPNPTTAIPTDSALRASVYTPDTEGPAITSYTLNLQDDILELTFNEPVLVSTMNFTRISLSSTANGTAEVVLSGGRLLPPGNEDGVLIVVVQLTDEDISQLKLDPSDIFTTFDPTETLPLSRSRHHSRLCWQWKPSTTWYPGFHHSHRSNPSCCYWI